MPDENSNSNGAATTAPSTPVVPVSEGSMDLGGSLVDKFMSHELPFQKTDESREAAKTAVAQTDIPIDESFEDQSKRMGWDKGGENAAPPAQPAAVQQNGQAAVEVLPTFKTVQPLQLGIQRDFTGMTPVERKIFGAMSKEAYAVMRPIYDQFKKIDGEHETRLAKETETQKLVEELKGQKFYGLDGAWQLDPEIQPLIGGVNNLVREADFWQKQLAAIDAGEKIQLLEIGPDGKSVVISEPRDPIAGDRALITRAMHDALTKHSSLNSQLQTSVQNFKAKYSGWDNQVSQVNEQIFGKFNKQLEPHREKMAASWPLAVRHQPIYQYATNATIFIDFMMRENAELKKAVAAKALNNPARASASPTTVAASAGTTPDRMSSLERMAKMTGRGLSALPAN